MAKDRKKLQHMHSSIPDKQPTPASLEVGEIAVNNAKEQEFLSIKNTNNKVVRFSSDGQIIEWIERKEVMPYKGYVRGDGGPTATSGDSPSADAKGSYGISNEDLLANKSQLVFKLNQVAASATTKHEKVNGAKDLYGVEVNPTDDYGVNDGAGFFIDMSRYAMIDANPSFSALTATCQTRLSGNTYISDGASANTYGTDSGHTLYILTTDVSAHNKTWKEEISAKTEDISGRTTTIGNNGERLHVIGTTTEVHDGNVTITNKSNVVENTSGTTTETKKGVVTETNLSAKTENTSGTSTTNIVENNIVNVSGETHITTTGNTAIHTESKLGLTAKDDILESSEADIVITADQNVCETAGVQASFYGVAQTNLGLDCADSTPSVVTNLYGDTINTDADTANTTIGTAITQISIANTTVGTATTQINSANTKINTATTVIGTADTKVTSATTVIGTNTTTISGNTKLNVSGTTTENHSGTTTINNTGKTTVNVVHGTEINSCEGISANTNNFIIKQCQGATGDAEFEFCDGFKVKSNDVEITQCTDGSITITERIVGINAENTTINDSGNTIINTTGETHVTTSGNTAIHTESKLGLTAKDDILMSSESSVTITANEDVCETAGNKASFYGVAQTNLGLNCADSTSSVVTNVYGDTINTDADTANTTIGTAITQINSANTTVGTAVTQINSANTNIGTAITVINTASTKINSAFTSANTATTIIKVANTSATTATLSGNTLDIKEATRISAVTPTMTVSGTNLNITETNTTINSCGKIEFTTDNFTVNSCSNTGTSTFNFCNGYTLNSDKVTIEECNGNGTILIKEKGINLSGGTLSSTTTADTIVKVGGNLSAFTTGNTSITSTGNTIIQSTGNGSDVCITANDAAAFKGGNKTNIGKDCSDGGQTKVLNINGDTINITGGTMSAYTSGKTCVVANTDLNLGGNTNTRIGADCAGNPFSDNVYISATTLTEVKAPTITLSGETTNITGSSNVNIKGNDICISGGTEASMGAKSVKVGTNCDGTTIATGITAISTNNITLSSATINESGTTEVNIYGGNNVNINSKDVCVVGTNEASIGGKDVKIGTNCAGTTIATGISAFSTNNVTITSSTVNITGTSNTNVYGGDVCISGGSEASMGAQTVNVGTDCGSSMIATTINISGTTINEGGTTNNNTFTTVNTTATTINNTATTINNNTTNYNITGETKIDGSLTVTENTYISGDTYIDGTLHLTKGIEKKLYFQTGTTDVSQSPYDGHEDRTITIPSCVSHLNRAKLNYEYGVDVTSKSNGTYDPGENCSDSASDTISIPTCVSHINRAKLDWAYVTDKASMVAKTYDPGANCTNSSIADKVNIPKSIKCMDEYGSCFSIDIPLCVTGTITASGAIYSSDRNLKDNIDYIERADFKKVKKVPLRSFSFKDDETKRKTYGVIAQEVQEAGLTELVHVKQDGTLGVDYTSMLILRAAYLEDYCGYLSGKLAELENKINQMQKKD